MFLLLVVVLVWGVSWFAITLQLGTVHPMVSISWRFFIAGVALLLWLKLKGKFIAPKFSDMPRVIALSVFLFCLNFTCFYFATGFVTSGLISVVFAAAVFITVLNQWVWRRILPEKKTLLGAMFGVAGIALLFAPSVADNLRSGQSTVLLGLALSVLGTWFFSIGNLISASLSRTTHLASTIACGMLIGAAFSAVIASVLGHSLRIPMDITYLLALLYLAIGASVIGFVAYLTLVANQGAAKAGYATVLFPIIALAISTIMEGYQWTTPAGLGVILATLGALIVFSPQRPHARKEPTHSEHSSR